MRQITDITELTPGTQIVEFRGDKIVFWEYLCKHPRNPEYVLLLESLSQNAIKQYIPGLLDSKDWYIDYTFEEIYEKQIEWHQGQIERLNSRIKDEQSKKTKENDSQADQKS